MSATYDWDKLFENWEAKPDGEYKTSYVDHYDRIISGENIICADDYYMPDLMIEGSEYQWLKKLDTLAATSFWLYVKQRCGKEYYLYPGDEPDLEVMQKLENMGVIVEVSE